ncbi:MAG: DNA alkylation repair protein, partial [Lactobacillus crispatus]|nr:DNA alkylation repair protein [Lactobacillus crispatus]
MNIETLKKEFSARANEEKANHLVGYMQNQFLFYGLQTP